MPSRFELSVHPFVVGASTDEVVVGGASTNPVQSFAENARPPVRGARWVEAARTELGALATMGFEALGRPAGFADVGGSMSSAETAFLLAIDPSEGETVRPDEATPMLPIPAPVLARPLRRSDTPARRVVTPEAARAILAQPTGLLAPSHDPEALQRITIGPAVPRASAPPPPRPRTSSFVGKLGVSVCPPPPARASLAPASSPLPRASFAPLAASTHRMVVVHQSRAMRAWNMAAAVLSGLAAAMVVMAVVVSV